MSCLKTETDIDSVFLQTKKAIEETAGKAGLAPADVFVLGCSTSEICGSPIGKAGSAVIGETVVKAALEVLSAKGIFLAVQGCEHINRALVIERCAAERYGLEIVSVIPSLNAGGSCCTAAFKLACDPVMVEHICAKAGADIGDTEIGMHIKFVQVPLRLQFKEVGFARVTALKSRPKLIGGSRAVYSQE